MAVINDGGAHWNKLWNEADSPSVTGGGASGTWPISVTGSAGSVAVGNISAPYNFNPSGYVTLPNNQILQWVLVSALGQGATTNITWPIAFPHAAFGSWVSANSGSIGTANTSIYNTTSTGATVYNGQAGASDVFCYAIGY